MKRVGVFTFVGTTTMKTLHDRINLVTIPTHHTARVTATASVQKLAVELLGFIFVVILFVAPVGVVS